jgi:hypothetical protein
VRVGSEGGKINLCRSSRPPVRLKINQLERAAQKTGRPGFSGKS